MNVCSIEKISARYSKDTEAQIHKLSNTIDINEIYDKDNNGDYLLLNKEKEKLNNFNNSREHSTLNFSTTNKDSTENSNHNLSNINEFENTDFSPFFYSNQDLKDSTVKASKDNSDFSLDMVTADMDFEQVYSMYNSIQQKDALSAVDELKKLQMLNQQYVTALPSNFEQMNLSNDFHRSHLMDTTTNQQEKETLSLDSVEPRSLGSLGESNDVEFDQFFSHTESNALEKFLDNLANPANLDPLQFYNNYNTKSMTGNEDVSQLFNLHTMKPTVTEYKKSLKDELTEAFCEPLMNSLIPSPTLDQLPTPCESRNSLLIKNNLHSQALTDNNIDNSFSAEASYSPSELSPKRRRRVSHKPLLTLEQKRLNHSTLEQKRRQLCKLAYDRCLKLVINMEEYCREENKNKKSKRAKLNKEGLPNLSKHTALMKISGEIVRIKNKNEQLKRLLAENGV